MKKIYNGSHIFTSKLFLSVAIMLGLILTLSACGGSDDNNESADSGDKFSGEIEVWGWNIAAKSMELAAEDFMEEHPDAKIIVNDLGVEDLRERLTVGLGSGGSGLPDVSLVQSYDLPDIMEKFPDQFMNLGEMGFDQHIDKFVDYKSELVKNANGEIVAAPWDVGPAGVFYRVDLFEEAGVNPEEIKTWDDYIEAGKKIKEETGVAMIVDTVSSEDNLYRPMINQQGASYYTKDNETNIASKESEKAMTYMKRMYENDILMEVSDQSALYSAFINGEVASIPSGVWFSGTIKDQAPDQKGKWDVFRLPAFEEGGNRAANSGGSDLIIPTSSDNPELAYEFVKYFTTEVEPQMNALEEYGIFPSLIKAYDEPYFEEPSPFFNDSPIYGTFADIAQNLQPLVASSETSRAQDVVVDAQTSIILNDGNVEKVLNEAAERLSNETGRDRANE